MTKTCSVCKEEKEISAFYKDKKAKDGAAHRCKDCTNVHFKAWAEKNPEKYKEKQRKSLQKFKKNNIEKVRQAGREHYHKHKNDPEYKDKRKKTAARFFEKTNKIPKYKIQRSIKRGIYESIKAKKANRHWEELVDYSISELMTYLESKFDSNMNWDNYGSYWHIDHIKPQSWFDINSPEDQAFKECWALSNLQPLEAKENIRKGNRYEG
jgi:hypothetical protein